MRLAAGCEKFLDIEWSTGKVRAEVVMSLCEQRRFEWLVAALLCWAALLGADAFGAPRYSIVALEPLPGGLDSFATGINELGVVVGHSTLDRSGNVGRSRPVVWDANGRPTELWPNEGLSTPGGIPLGINNAGQIVGRYGVGSGVLLPETGIPPGRAFIWDSLNGRRDLGSLGGGRVEAVAINELGQVAGSSSTGRSQDQGAIEEAFLWDPINGMQGLGTLGGAVSRSATINNLGQIAGMSWLSDFSERPFLWDAVGGIQDLGSITGATTRAMGLNDVGQVIGFDYGISGFVIWTSGNPSSIPVTPGASFFPFDINDHGQIVGYMGRPEYANAEAFVWSVASGFVNLETMLPIGSSWDLTRASAINERGQIVGYGLLNEEIRGFLMTPVPEPSSLSSAYFAMLLTISTRRTRELSRYRH